MSARRGRVGEPEPRHDDPPVVGCRAGAEACRSGSVSPTRGPRAERTALIVSMYAVTIFTLTLLVTIGQFYSPQRRRRRPPSRRCGRARGHVGCDAAGAGTRRDAAARCHPSHGGEHDRPRNSRTVRRRRRSRYRSSDSTAPSWRTARRRLRTGRETRCSHPSRAIPTKVIVGTDLQSDLQSGLPGRPVRVGDSVEVRDAAHRRDPHIDRRRSREPGALGGRRPRVRSAGRRRRRSQGVRRPRNLLYVETAAGTNNDTVAAIVDGTHLPNGAYARSFTRLARDTLSAQRQFLDIGAGYATVGSDRRPRRDGGAHDRPGATSAGARSRCCERWASVGAR